ncbi:unnamed protein product [Polarella glacialis]|uniref:GAF domain-containing protein n=1 Tax=Polarella glacialis TaxID=89957 RepID=A0A813KS81_POLGL|nr:unnamed protein product [Polarella glacialis]
MAMPLDLFAAGAPIQWILPEENPEATEASESGHPTGSRDGQASAHLDQQLLRRLHRCDDLIKQLKHIIKAQHGKIEELREKLELATVSKSPLIAGYEIEDLAKGRQDNEELRRSMSRQQAELVKAKSDNSTLRKANKRLKGLLEHAGGPQPMPFVDSISDTLPDLMQNTQSSLMQNTQSSFRSVLSSGPATARTARKLLAGAGTTDMSATFGGGSVHFPVPEFPQESPRFFDSSAGSDQELNSPGKVPLRRRTRSAQAKPPVVSKVARLVTSLRSFWRDLESPVAALRALSDVTQRLLATGDTHGPQIEVMVYMLDPWLRTVATTKEYSKTEQPPIFYLGHGKQEIQALRHSSNSKVSAPRFTDLAALPSRTRNSIAIPVCSPNAVRTWAVLQVVIEDTRGTVGGAAPKLIQKMLQDVVLLSTSQFGFTDSQVSYLQLICGMVGGVLIHMEKLEQRARMVERTRASMEGTINVNKAISLADFEHRAKQVMAGFFAVNTIRVLFYDSDTKSLLISSSQMRKKGCVSSSISKGIVGQCAQKHQTFNVDDISLNPYIDPIADGLTRTGRPVGHHASMLVGPMIVDHLDANPGAHALPGL